MSNSAWANKTIPRPTKGVRLVKSDYTLRDIAKLCHRSFLEDAGQVRAFAKAFQPTRAGLRALFDFVDDNFTYVEDRGYTPRGKEISVQAVQSPSAMWHTTRQGDCKSFTVFIAATVHNMGLPVILRLVGYGSKYEKHIYPVAILDGREIPLDVVYKKQQNGPFGSEKLPMEKIQDIVEKPGLYKVGKMATQVSEADLVAALNNINAAADSMPNYVNAFGGDITDMSAGEFDAWQLNQLLSTKGKSIRQMPDAVQQQIRQHVAKRRKPAFPPVKVAVPVPANQVGGIKDVVDKIGDALKKALKKFVNVFHKEDAKKVAPFFLYLFMTPAQLAKASPEVKRRHAAQNRIVDGWVQRGKMGTRAQILASMSTGFFQRYGVTPKTALAVAFQRKKVKGYGAVGDEATLGQDDTMPPTGSDEFKPTSGSAEAGLALKALSELEKNKESIAGAVKKVFSIIKAIFGKKDKAEDDANTSNVSDPSLLEGLPADAASDGSTPPDAASDGATSDEKSDMPGWLLPAGLGLAAWLLLK
jgi:hypothetical protein